MSPLTCIELSGNHRVDRVVVVDGNRLAALCLEREHRDGLVGRALAIRSLPPAIRLRVDDLAIDVDVRDALSRIPCAPASGVAVRAVPVGNRGDVVQPIV